MPKRAPKWIWRNRGILWVIIITVLLTVSLWGVLNVAQTNRKNSREARFIFCKELNTVKAINRDDLKKDINDLRAQVKAGIHFLHDHPQGTKDFSRQLILDSINTIKKTRYHKRATRKTLIIRNCREFAKNPTGRAK